jgi:hypothetical protein
MDFTLAIPRIFGSDSNSICREITSQPRTADLGRIYYEAYLEQADALGREKYLKSGAGRRFLKVQLAHYLRKNPIRSIATSTT